MTSPRSYVVRAANGADPSVAKILMGMHKAIFGTTAPQIDPAEGYWWMAWKGFTPVAFAGLKEGKSAPATGYLHRSGVLPMHRGHGLQVRLIRAREGMARELGWTRVVTDTTANVHSANSLIRAGYLLFKPDPIWAFEESLYWVRVL